MRNIYIASMIIGSPIWIASLSAIWLSIRLSFLYAVGPIETIEPSKAQIGLMLFFLSFYLITFPAILFMGKIFDAKPIIPFAMTLIPLFGVLSVFISWPIDKGGALFLIFSIYLAFACLISFSGSILSIMISRSNYSSSGI